MPENPASYRVVRTKSYLFNKAPDKTQLFHHVLERLKEEGMLIENAQPDEGDIGSEASRESQFAGE
ncbi:hypothetical protein FKK57_25910 [Klebsiella pneumoniae]|nr:hypothetical protein [Klebsiella pneumoniae]